MRSELNYAGKNLSEFGMWFDNSKVYKKPSKRFMGYDIPARNGTLYQSENKFNNVVIEFDCFIKDNFDQNYHDLVNFLNSFDTYQKLVNSYNGNMYRMALFHEAVEVDTGQFLKDGRFKLFFDCKPQEYYADGAEFERIAPHSDIYTGNPAELVNEGESTVVSLRVGLEPIQNLNGYDSPWVGGAGKNKFNPPSTGTNAGVTYTLNSDGSITANGTASGYSYRENYVTLSAGNYVLTGGGNGVNVQVRNRSTDSAIAISNTAGASVSFTLSADTEVKCRLQVNQGTTLSNLKVYPMIRLSSVTDATYAPYENVCPITGHTSASVTRTGKNLLAPYVYTTTNSGVQFAYKANGDIVLDGTSTGATSVPTSGEVTVRTLLKAGTYTPSVYGDNVGIQVIAFNPVERISEGGTFTLAQDREVFARLSLSANQTYNNAVVHMQVEKGSVATTYEPYQGNTYTIDLNGTRYGGTVDLATGVLKVTHGFVTFDGSTDENWSLQNGRRCAIGNALPNYKVVSGTDRTIGALSNLFKEDTPNNTWTSEIGFSIEAGGILAVRQFSTNTMTVADFKTFLQSNPMQICYPLQTPQTVQLTAQQISLLTGANYISSSGEVTVTTRTPLILKNPSPMTAKPVFKFNNITAPFTVSANGETIISFQSAIRLVGGGIVNNMFFNATGTNLIMQKQGTPNYEETSFLINSGWLPAGRYYLATMPIGNLEVTSMDGRHLYSSGGTFTLTDITQVKVWYVITPDASTPQTFNFPIFLRPLGTLYVDSELMDCYMLDGDTAYSFNECVSLPKDFLQLDERTVMTMTSGAVGFIAPNWWRL